MGVGEGGVCFERGSKKVTQKEKIEWMGVNLSRAAHSRKCLTHMQRK